jgi:hypothetical protein
MRYRIRCKRHALRQIEQRCFRRIARNSNENTVKKRGGSLDHVEMSERNRVE